MSTGPSWRSLAALLKVVAAGEGMQQKLWSRASPVTGRCLAGRGSRSGLLQGVLRDAAQVGGDSVELTVFPDGRAIVGGGSQPDFARGIYARYVGH